MVMMKMRHALLIAALSLLASCGGGGGSDGSGSGSGTDFASITVEGAGTTLYTETTSTVATNGYSPDVYVVTSPSPSIGTYIFSLDWDNAATDYVMRFEIHVWGYGAGTYNIADNNFVVFAPAGGPTYSAVTHSLTSGSITFSEFGAAGGKVKGTFDVVSMIVGTPSQTARLTGSFSANRY